MRKADGIFTGDIHIRESVPTCRTDDFMTAQWNKLKEISALQKEHECPVYCTGDFFDKWKPSPELITKTSDLIDNWFSIYGDHDLAQHSIKLKHKSGLTTLSRTKKLTIVDGGHGSDKTNTKLPKNQKPSVVIKNKRILLWHVLTWKNELPYPGCTSKSAKQILKKYSQFDAIFVGDNHKPFVEKYKGRILVNTGSMMRIRADQIDYKPAVWLYYADKNEVVPHYLTIEPNVISREHIEVKEQRNERIDAFISKIKTDFKVTMSFSKNVMAFFDKNKTNKKVRKLVLKHLKNETES